MEANAAALTVTSQAMKKQQKLHRDDLTTFWKTVVAGNSDAAFVGAKIFYFHRARDPILRHLESPDVIAIHLIRDRIFDSYI